MSVGATAAIAVALPIVGGLFVLLLGKWPNAREAATLITSGALFSTVYSMLGPVREGAISSFTLVEVVPGVTLGFEVEPLGLLFALVASFLWIVTSLYAIGYMRGHHEENQTRFFFFFAIAIDSGFAGTLPCPADGYTTSSHYRKIRDHEYYSARHAGVMSEIPVAEVVTAAEARLAAAREGEPHAV